MPARVDPQILIDERSTLNANVLQKVRAGELEGVTLRETQEDADFGAMLAPVPLEDWHVLEYTLSRRFIVSQWSKAKNAWKHRVVDHMTESGINPSAAPLSTNRTQSLDWQVWLLCFFRALGFSPRQWKRDFRKAFRCLPNQPSHLRFAGTVFSDAGMLWFSVHLAQMFGPPVSLSWFGGPRQCQISPESQAWVACVLPWLHRTDAASEAME